MVIFVMIIVRTGRKLRELKRITATPNPTPEQNTLAVHAAAVGAALTVVLIGGMFADFSKCEVQIWMIALLAALTQRASLAVAPAPEPLASPVGLGRRVGVR